MTARQVEAELKALGDDADAVFLQRFFKTGPGQYGAGDRFLGVRVPVVRRLARAHRDLSLKEVLRLLRSPFHEARLLALLLMVRAYGRGDAAMREEVYRAYLANTDRVDSWDLVDASAHRIVGPHLEGRSHGPLRRLARSKSLWERRIAIMATLHFIRRGEFEPTLEIAERLLDDRHDLIHKAVGWMLREVGNRDRAVEERFLNPHYQRMPRTMLRYAIEKFPSDLRLRYLNGAV